MIDFGMPTLLELNSAEENAALCRALGLRFVELNMNLPQYQPGVLNPAALRIIGEREKIFFTLHLDEKLEVGDFNPYVAEAYRRTVREAIVAAKQLEIPVLTMHFSRGVYFTLPEERVFLFERYRKEYLDAVERFRDECEREIGGAKIRICVENTSGFLPFQLDALDRLLQSPVFGLTFDIGHNHSAGNADKPFLQSHSDRICHMHLHDACGKNDHLALGTGELALPEYLALAQKRQCRCVLETKTVAALRQSVAWIKDFFG